MCTLAHINATPDILYDQLASPSLLWYFVRQRDYDGFTWTLLQFGFTHREVHFHAVRAAPTEVHAHERSRHM